ncbi:MAG: efflux RND transporter periplasmic adaptor subunit, partial [bacterium]|nr:efflux RND transporter periplasmic adaptor subunit [bacterium]
MKKITRTLLAGAFVAVALAGQLSAQGPTVVQTDGVTRMDFHDQITLIGRTEAIVSSSIVSEVGGKVQSMDAAEGVWVRKNQPLVSIDPERTRLALAGVEAQCQQAKAQADLAAKDLTRSEDLFGRSLISESRIDSVRVAAVIAEQAYNRLKAERDRLALDLENCTLRAPFSGYTVRHLVDVGEGVGIGTPVIEMVDLSRVKVTVDLPERHFGHVSTGTRVLITVSGDTEDPVVGTVSGIAPSASRTAHTFPVIVTVDNQQGRLGGGMLVKATLSLSDSFSSLAVSKDALVRQGSQTMVYTIVEGKASPIAVST